MPSVIDGLKLHLFNMGDDDANIVEAFDPLFVTEIPDGAMLDGNDRDSKTVGGASRHTHWPCPLHACIPKRGCKALVKGLRARSTGATFFVSIP